MIDRVVLHGPPERVLSESALREVWGIDARWLGEPGQRALNARLT